MFKLIYVFLLIFFISCQKNMEVTAKDPVWNKDACAHCRMVVSEKRFAVQRILDSGEILYYDDLACALKHHHPSGEGKLYVYPEGENTWVPADQAKYQGGLVTPMNGGFGAVKVGGTLSFEEVKIKLKE